MMWEVEERRLKQDDLWRMQETRFKFLVKSVYDLLPTPQNKNVWFNTEENVCAVCGRIGTLKHILSACEVALSQGRYTYRHNKVLRVLATLLERVRIRSNASKGGKKTGIAFVKEGQKAKPVVKEKNWSYLDSSRDWKMAVDLDRQLKIPDHIVKGRTERPDLLLYSNNTKQS